jgi:glutaredoxin
VTGDAPLLVYGTGWCRDVRRTRALLDRLDVPYQYVDVEADRAAERRVRRLQKGRRRIPAVVVPATGEVLIEPSDSELEAALARM